LHTHRYSKDSKKKFNFDVLGSIGKWFAQVLALNTIYSTYTSGGGGEK
jgi:hypothetical protein